MKSIFNSKTLSLSPYVLSKRFDESSSDSWTLLDWNETNNSLPDFIIEGLLTLIQNKKGTAYADGDDSILNSKIAKYSGVEEHNVLVFNGSDSALKLVFECVIDDGDKVVIVPPEYSQINTFIYMAGGKIHELKFNNPFNVSVEDIIDKLSGNKILYLSNPNNPTGRVFSRESIVSILETGIILFLDEAYAEFCGFNCGSLVTKYRNLFIFRTFSKSFGLAGFRIGYLLSNEENISIIQKVRNSKEINLFGQVAAKLALENTDYYSIKIAEILLLKEEFIDFVNSLNQDLIAYKSSANFVIIRSTLIKELMSFLEQNKILIRDRTNMYYLSNCARVSIGTRSEMDLLKLKLTEFFSLH
jgi:histidinol-phosphate aminotransferase